MMSVGRPRVVAWLPIIAVIAMAPGCGGSEPVPVIGTPDEPAASVAVAPTGPPIMFRFEALEGEPLTTESVAGRFTIIAMVATYDVASSAQARFLNGLVKDHTPRINVALLVLEPESSRPMVEAFVGALAIEYPVAWAGAPTIAGKGPFEGLNSIPSIVILDPEGREVWRNIGLIDDETLSRELERLEDR